MILGAIYYLREKIHQSSRQKCFVRQTCVSCIKDSSHQRRSCRKIYKIQINSEVDGLINPKIQSKRRHQNKASKFKEHVGFKDVKNLM